MNAERLQELGVSPMSNWRATSSRQGFAVEVWQTVANIAGLVKNAG
jgi:hypothetical protein